MKKDYDIQTSFEDENDSPIWHKGGRNVSNVNVNSIELSDDQLEEVSPLYGRKGHEGNQEHRRRIFTSAPKRRKVSHPAPGTKEPITISSSPENDELHDIDIGDDASSSAAQSDLDDNLARTAKLQGNDDSHKFTRFRPAVAEVLDSPSLPPTVFKSMQEDSEQISIGSGPVLPDVFSPSRRRGKRDYVHGGSADLVRSWVLNIAAQESQVTSLSEETVVVAQIQKDHSGRFVVVVDENGAQWLLPEQQKKAGGNVTSATALIRPGLQLMLRGLATKWILPIDSPSLHDMAVAVAANWEILPSR